MTDYVVPCETFARLCNVLTLMHEEANEWFNAVRIDNGCAVVSNRIILAAENIGGPSGVAHVIADPALIEACRKEAPYNSNLTITVNEPLKFAVAKTTLGYIHQGNCCVWSNAPNDFDRWRSIVPRQPIKKSKGGMYWDADNIANLAKASPSGRLIFEEFIDTCRPTIVRDVNDPQWFGLFNPWSGDDLAYEAATLPSWMV